MAKPIVNDLTQLRRIAYPGIGENPGGNCILALYDEVERLRAELATAKGVNAALARELAASEETSTRMQNECMEVGEVFGNDDTIGGESLHEYVARQVAKLRGANTEGGA